MYCSEGYHANESSYEHMRNVLVVTMHSFRNYSSHTSWKANTTVSAVSLSIILPVILFALRFILIVLFDNSRLQAMNDYVVAYHDAVVLFGHVMRKNLKEMKQQPFSGVIEQPFRNIHFEGKSVLKIQHHTGSSLMLCMLSQVFFFVFFSKRNGFLRLQKNVMYDKI